MAAVLLQDTGSAQDNSSPRAAILDQHYTLQSNQVFIEQTSRYLENYGFVVDLYQGNDVTVDLYRRLPKYGYQLIIFRVHSALRLDKEESNYGTWLFTCEPYSETRYVDEQIPGQLAKARIEEGYPWLFAVGSKFVAENMRGKFDRTIIIMMGCGPMYIEDMAQAFIDKGASACMGWDERASLGYLDDATLALVSRLLIQELTVEQAVEGVMSEIGPDKAYNAQLKYYPPKSHLD